MQIARDREDLKTIIFFGLAQFYIEKYTNSTLHCDSYHGYCTYTFRNNAFPRLTLVFFLAPKSTQTGRIALTRSVTSIS